MNRKDLANDIWRACDIMRRDDGTTGVLQYMEQLSWLIFLKIFEDIEKRLEDEAKFAGREYQEMIEPKYRWSSWARKDWRGEELMNFIDNELFPYLRSLTGSLEREKIAMIFNEISGNRMKSPYNLKDVIDLIDKINFNDVEDSHVVSQVYEELLLRMGREGGLAGEFYTPRPIVRLMVKIVDPKIGETVFDPFCGSCGFLVESYKCMKESKELTVEDYERLQKETFYAQEKKPVPYLIGVMNCMLHDLLTPNVIRKNTLEDNIRNIPESRRFDVILTNPPFGGKESRQIQQNFPVQSQATELLALQYVMKSLKKGGRCGIVVPEGILFRGDAFAQVKKELLENFNLHTIISLPSGVFANVTSSGQGPKTNLLFFDRTGPSREIWYYEHNPPEGKKYTKANPISDEDLADCYAKWKNREISENSWIVPVEEIVKRGYDLTAKNPNRKDEFEDKPPEELVASVLEKETAILKILEELQTFLGVNNGERIKLDAFIVRKSIGPDVSRDEVTETLPGLPKGWKWVTLGDKEITEKFVSGGTPSTKVEEYWKGHIPWITGADIEGLWISKGRRFITDEAIQNSATHLVRRGTVLLVTRTCIGKVGIAANDICFSQDITGIQCGQKILPEFLAYYLLSKQRELASLQRGVTIGGLTRDDVKNIRIPLPPLQEQKRIVARIEAILSRVGQARRYQDEAKGEIEAIAQAVLREAFRGKL